jgi:DHA2 family multidrug resistance protein
VPRTVSRLRRWLPAMAVMSSAVLEVLDTSVVNISLPHIAGSLSATIDEATWVLTSYLVANAIILPISGWLASRFGRKRLLMTVVTSFTVSSVCCGLAPNLSTLVFFRVMQGTTGGGLQPLSQAVLLESVPVEERGSAMAFWGLGIIAAPILGPTLGGWITDNYYCVISDHAGQGPGGRLVCVPFHCDTRGVCRSGIDGVRHP